MIDQTETCTCGHPKAGHYYGRAHCIDGEADGCGCEGYETAVTVAALQCSKCGVTKPRTEFYASELENGHRCKVCFRARINSADKRRGRQSTSMGLPEIRWLLQLFRALPSSELSVLSRRPEYAILMRKALAMDKRGTANAIK